MVNHGTNTQDAIEPDGLTENDVKMQNMKHGNAGHEISSLQWALIPAVTVCYANIGAFKYSYLLTYFFKSACAVQRMKVVKTSSWNISEN